MQLSPQAWPFLHTFQHAARVYSLGSTKSKIRSEILRAETVAASELCGRREAEPATDGNVNAIVIASAQILFIISAFQK
jgi:hypothetical protein